MENRKLFLAALVIMGAAAMFMMFSLSQLLGRSPIGVEKLNSSKFQRRWIVSQRLSPAYENALE